MAEKRKIDDSLPDNLEDQDNAKRLKESVATSVKSEGTLKSETGNGLESGGVPQATHQQTTTEEHIEADAPSNPSVIDKLSVVIDGKSEKNEDQSSNVDGEAERNCLSDGDKAQPALLDPLSYTQAEEFTSEIFKIQIHNLPKFGFNELKKRLKNNLRLNPHKLKSADRYVTYVCFKNETDRNEALNKINGHVWKGKALHAKIAAPVSDPYLQKKNRDSNDGDKTKTPSNRMEKGVQLSPEEAENRLKATVRPLWNVDYPEQLKMKEEKIKTVLKKMTEHHFVRHMFKDKSLHEGMACELLPIVPSPVTSEYRNKNEYTIGYGLDGQTIQVGFRYGMYRDGTTSVGDCTNLGIAMPPAIPVLKSFREFVSTSKWLPFRQETASGHWQTLTVRTFRTGDVMAMVDFVPRKLEKTEISAAKDSLKQYFTSGEGKDVNIKSFYFRVMGAKGKGVSQDLELLYGEPHVYESLLELKFRISPEAFFQVNTLATEKLYELIADWSNVSPSTTVLDICCGTGTIGLSMAKKVKDVVGVEMCRQAIEDAKVNASINGITNATFHCAKVEDVIGRIMSSIQSSSSNGNDVVAVVDPPRAGLHKDVIKTLRKSSEIKRLVYVSCNPDSALDNFVDIIRPETGRHKGSPFQIVKAIPLDLFPGTRHCELVILFTRVDDVTDDDGLADKDLNDDRNVKDESASKDLTAEKNKTELIEDMEEEGKTD